LHGLEQAQPEPRPVRVWLQDESRLGLHLPLTRRLTAQGIKPIQLHQPLYQYYWLYAAVEPATGQACWWEMPALDSVCFEAFVQQLGEQYAQALNVLVVDNAPAHTAHTLQLPDNVVLLFLPPYCPELNPIERLWEDLKSRISATDQTVRTELNALREHVAEIINRYTLEQLRSLTGYDYILDAIRGI
jgi:transposase